MRYLDDGGGVTQTSIKFFCQNKNKIGDVRIVMASKDGLASENKSGYQVNYTCVIIGSDGSIYLSGCNCGYGGEGPNGTAKILAQLGVPLDLARHVMYCDNINYDVKSGIIKCDGIEFTVKGAW